MRYKGPYASAILRFQIRFPPTYPDLPPLVTFTTEIFHPLIVPLTTYTFTTGSSDTDTVSATDEGRLSPGGFSLRHGFPHWFGRSKKNAATSLSSSSSSRNVSGNSAASDGSSATKSGTGGGSEGAATTATESETSSVGREDDASSHPSKSTLPTISSPVRISPVPSSTPLSRPQTGRDVPIVKLLNYIRSTFDDESVLDSVPLEAAGNPGAWHAWRSHRKGPEQGASPGGPLSPDAKTKRVSPQARPPGEWNWEGVWVKRTQNGIKNSYLESVLFGTSGRGAGGGTDDLVSYQRS